MTDMDQAIGLTLGVEGEWSDHPSDPGGKTMFGITEATLRRAKRQGVVERSSIRQLTVEDAKAIYRELYWMPVRADDLPRGLNALVFDVQVNSGQGGRRLQHALNAVARSGIAIDNVVGDQTVGAALSFVRRDGENIYRLLAEVSARRFLHWAGLAIWPTFRVGWARRGARVLVHATRMADGSL